MPRWLVLLLTLVALAVFGPPALGILAGLLGVAIGLTAVALKLGVVVLFIAMLVALGRAIFGSRAPDPAPLAPRADILESVEARFDAEEAQRRAALDRELEAALRNAR
jgi:membrane protein implicated in regulation of membrane protease activity